MLLEECLHSENSRVPVLTHPGTHSHVPNAMAKAIRGQKVFIAHYGCNDFNDYDNVSAFLSVHSSFEPAFRAVLTALWYYFPEKPPTRTADDRFVHDYKHSAEFDEDFRKWERVRDKYTGEGWLPSTPDEIRELLFDYTAKGHFLLETAEVDETFVEIQLLLNTDDGEGGFKPSERISLLVTCETVEE